MFSRCSCLPFTCEIVRVEAPHTYNLLLLLLQLLLLLCLTNGNEAASLRAQAAIVWVRARRREIGAIAQIAILRRWHFISNRVNKQLPSGWFPNFLLQLQPIHIRSAVPTHVATTCFPLSGDICCLSAVGLQSHSCCRWKCLWAPH